MIKIKPFVKPIDGIPVICDTENDFKRFLETFDENICLMRVWIKDINRELQFGGEISDNPTKKWYIWNEDGTMFSEYKKK